MEQQSSNMHVHEWSSRDIAAFNALFSQNPYAKQFRNRWPNGCTALFVLCWTTNGVERHAVHFCESEANWRAEIYREAGTVASVEKRWIGQGETHAVVDGRQRGGCTCENCLHHGGDLSPVTKPKTMSSAKARKLARAQASDRFR